MRGYVLTERPKFERGQRVRVIEPGIREWGGIVVAMKQASMGWRVEIRDERGDWSVPSEYVEAL